MMSKINLKIMSCVLTSLGIILGYLIATEKEKTEIKPLVMDQIKCLEILVNEIAFHMDSLN